MDQSEVHELLIAKLLTRNALDADDLAAVRGLALTLRESLPNAYIVRERQQPGRCAFILSGFAFRHKLAANGGRQIVGILMPGDFTDLQQLLLRQSDHNVQALTRLKFAEIAADAIDALAMARPAIARALWTDTLIEGSISRELALNIGRRDGASRIAHLLCEFEQRLSHARLAPPGSSRDSYELPMTQEQIGDATGLTAVHVNRVLKLLDSEGLISRKGRFVRIEQWGALARRADFDPLYLHLDNATPMPART